MTTSPSRAPGATGAFLALGAFGVFSAHDVIVKALGAVYSPVQIVFFSVLFGFPLVNIILMRDRAPGTLIPHHPWWTAARTLAVIITGVSAFYAFSVLPLAQVYAILFAMPLIITVLSVPILGERVRLRRWMAVLVGLIGVLIVLRPGAVPLEPGHIAALTAACSGAMASIIVRKIGQDERSVVLLLYPMVANFILMGTMLAFVYEPMPIQHLAGNALMAVLALAGTMLLITAYRRGEAVAIAPMQYSQILWATLYGAVFFGERPDLMTALGAAVIIASGIYILVREGTPGTSENRPVSRGRGRPETGTFPRPPALVDRAAKANEGLAKTPPPE